MLPRCKDLCRDPRVILLGLEDGLIPEADSFTLGKPPDVKLLPIFYAEQRMTEPLVAAIGKMPRLPDIVISDHLTWAGGNAARAHGIEHACHMTWPLRMLEEMGTLPTRSLAHYVGRRIRILRSSSLTPSFLRPSGPPQAFLDRVRQHCAGGSKRDGKVALILVTSSFGIEEARPLPPFVKMIGRSFRTENAEKLDEYPELKAFLDNNSEVVYVTFGSRVLPPPALVRSVGDALLAGGWTVVWSLKRAEQASLSRAVLASGRFFVRAWLPQEAALAHPSVKAAVTHCGMGGLFECASNGIPIIPFPFLLSADQPVNARAAEAMGFGVRPRLPPFPARLWQERTPGGDPVFTPVAIREAVEKAVSDPALREAAERVKRAVLSTTHGRGAVDAIEAACLYGTDHMASRGAEEGLFGMSRKRVLIGTAAIAAVGLVTMFLSSHGKFAVCRCMTRGGDFKTR